MMQLEVLRFNDNGNSTNGLLFDVSDGKNTFLCYTLEDEDRLEKVYGKTRIPEGEYNICFRSVGGFNTRYSKRFAGIHMGMLEIMDVTGFTNILIHCGNNAEDTAGCLLLGDSQTNNLNLKGGFIGNSVTAYMRVYQHISSALESGEDVVINYKIAQAN
tara:strand:- start:13938 stop:14414 length:477 start_codon:yes stop_codon:yes gene_type:complete